MAKKLKIFGLKIHKGAGIKKKIKTFLNKGTKHKKIIQKVQTQKIKILKGPIFDNVGIMQAVTKISNSTN